MKAVYSGGKKLTLILQQQQVIKSNKSNKFDNPTTNKQMQLERRRVVGGDWRTAGLQAAGCRLQAAGGMLVLIAACLSLKGDGYEVQTFVRQMCLQIIPVWKILLLKIFAVSYQKHPPFECIRVAMKCRPALSLLVSQCRDMQYPAYVSRQHACCLSPWPC